jgi:hypothetical protein
MLVQGEEIDAMMLAENAQLMECTQLIAPFQRIRKSRKHYEQAQGSYVS